MRFSQEDEEEENDEFYSLEEPSKKLELAKEETSKFGGEEIPQEKKKCKIMFQNTITPNRIMNGYKFKMLKSIKTQKMSDFVSNEFHNSESNSRQFCNSEKVFLPIREQEECTSSDKKKKSNKFLNGGDDHQRGGGDEKESNYSFNPKFSQDNITALVPYKNKVIEHLEKMLPDTPEFELSKELTYKIQCKQVGKILKEEYDFDNPKPFNIQDLSKPKPHSSYFVTRTSMKQNETNLGITEPFELGHNVENYLLYKKLNKGKKVSTMSLNPVQEKSLNRLSPAHSECKERNTIDRNLMEINSQPVYDRLYQESTYSSSATHLPSSLRPNLMSLRLNNKNAFPLKTKQRKQNSEAEEEYRKDAAEFVNKINKEKEKREQRKNKIIRLRDKKHFEKLKGVLHQREQREQEQQKLQIQKRQKIIERITKIKEDRKRAKSRMKECSHKPLKIPLYLQKEKEFKKEQQEQERKRREYQLNNRRDIYQRVSLSEIRRHAREHDDTIENNLTILKNRRVHKTGSCQSVGKMDSTPMLFNSKFLQNAIEEEKEKKVQLKVKEQQARDKLDKATRFS
ncbi:unnamed protein product [Moneuplotes crassus]|uniref:Uncharacterized protein n=1 Tax=Euplotes crassus TaxID=5936 RepID=A0AAD2D7K1_EUPCR|nr:unnamed protein product [Moneuplotes crassus]